MKPYYLLSVDLNGDNFGMKPPRNERRMMERAKELELYSVGSEERIRIRPVLPQAWHGLDDYLKALGCPKGVADAVLQKLRELRGYKRDISRSFIGANVFEDDYLEIVLIEASGRVTKVCLMFEDR